MAASGVGANAAQTQNIAAEGGEAIAGTTNDQLKKNIASRINQIETQGELTRIGHITQIAGAIAQI